MAESKTWLEVIEALDPVVHDMMLRETVRTIFRVPLPQGFEFLAGFVDLGLGHLNLDTTECDALLRAFCSTGIEVPCTDLRMRFTYPHTVIESADGSERASLPETWKQAVLVINNDCVPTWIGKTLMRKHPAAFDLSAYREVGEGWVPV